MDSSSYILVYLQVLITILAFGVGFPSLMYSRPTWLRRIRARYSVWHDSHKIIVFFLFLFAIIYLGYLFAAEPCKRLPSTSYGWSFITIFVFAVFIVFLSKLFMTESFFLKIKKKVSGKTNDNFGYLIATGIAIALKISLAFGFLFFLILCWCGVGKTLSVIFLRRNSFPGIVFSIEQYLELFRDNAGDISNLLLFISFIAVGVLWYRLYLYRFDTVLERLVQVTECRLKHRSFFCFTYWLLVIKERLFGSSLGGSKGPIWEKSIQDFGTMGVNAEVQGDRVAVLRELRDISGWLNLSETVAIRDLCKALLLILNIRLDEGVEEFTRALEILTILISRASKDMEELTSRGNGDSGMQTAGKIKGSVLIVLDTFGEVGEHALRRAGTGGERRILKAVRDAIKVLPEESRPKLIFRFGVAALESEKKANLYFVNDLWKLATNPGMANTASFYYMGLLARIARKGPSATQWAKGMLEADYEPEEFFDMFSRARNFFVKQVADFETADAIISLCEYMKACLG